jgi:L,D-transpeptidase ErfK/SrfK
MPLGQGQGMIWALVRVWSRYSSAIFVAAALAAMPAAASQYPLSPGQTVVGDLSRHAARQGEVFPDIARRSDVGYTALAAANPDIDPWIPKAGQIVTIPSLYILPDAPHQGIVINLAQWRLFYFPRGGGSVVTYPLGLGVIGQKTPLGETRVVRKQANPSWYPPASIRAEEPDLPAVVPPGPDNPLGAFALYLGWKNYRIHGTNKPDGVGRNVSHGCIRLYPNDIESLFGMVGVGTPVRVVSEPATAGWAGGRLYVQVYPSQRQTEEIDTERSVSDDPAPGVREVVRAAAGQFADQVDWERVEAAANGRTGLPVAVAERPALVSDAMPEGAGGAAQSAGLESPGSPPPVQGGESAFDRLLDQLISRATPGPGDPDSDR